MRNADFGIEREGVIPHSAFRNLQAPMEIRPHLTRADRAAKRAQVRHLCVRHRR